LHELVAQGTNAGRQDCAQFDAGANEL